MNKPTPEKMKELTSLLLSRAQDSVDESYVDRCQDAQDDTRYEAEKLLVGAGFASEPMDDDAWDGLVSELADSIRFVPEHYELAEHTSSK
jgi:hypothetical protein